MQYLAATLIIYLRPFEKLWGYIQIAKVVAQRLGNKTDILSWVFGQSCLL